MNMLLCLKKIVTYWKTDMLNIDEIKQKLTAIKAQGFVKTHRKGPTGIGKTLEDLLGIAENNIALPDFGTIELKAQRENHTGLTTLFTFNKKAWVMKPLDAIRKYGSEDKDGRLGMYYTMGLKPNSAGLFLLVDDTTVSVRHTDGSVIVAWKLADIQDKFMKKVSSVLLVKAKVEERDGIEYFCYDRARLLTGGTTVQILKSQFESEKLLIDLRLHDMVTRARNHGTGFRIYEKDMETLYTSVKEISF